MISPGNCKQSCNSAAALPLDISSVNEISINRVPCAGGLAGSIPGAVLNRIKYAI